MQHKQPEAIEKKSPDLTSSEVVILVSWLPGAKTGTFWCRRREEWGPCRAEHHHLLQLRVAIHGGVREPQGLGVLQGWENHLSLGCSHPMLVLKLQGWDCADGWCWVRGGWAHVSRAVPRRWKESLSPVQGALHTSSDAEEDAAFLSLVRDSCSPVVLSLSVFLLEVSKDPLVFSEKIKRLLYTHSLKFIKINLLINFDFL